LQSSVIEYLLAFYTKHVLSSGGDVQSGLALTGDVQHDEEKLGVLNGQKIVEVPTGTRGAITGSQFSGGQRGHHGRSRLPQVLSVGAGFKGQLHGAGNERKLTHRRELGKGCNHAVIRRSCV